MSNVTSNVVSVEMSDLRLPTRSFRWLTEDVVKLEDEINQDLQGKMTKISDQI